MSEISERLKQLRLESGLSQSEFASQLGITKELISQMERGVKNVSPATANSLKEIITEANIPTSFLEAYKRGQRFGKIVDILIKREGYTLKQLRENIFKTKGSDLSCMYVGIKSISRDVLIGLKTLGVNDSYLDYGEQPIFLGEQVELETIEIPYYGNHKPLDAIFKIEKDDISNTIKLSSTNTKADFYLDIDLKDTISVISTKSKVIFGIKQIQKQDIQSNILYICRCNFDLFINKFDSKKKVILTIPWQTVPMQGFNLNNLSSIFTISEVRYIAE